MTKLALELAKARREFDLFFEEDIKKIFQKYKKRIYLMHLCYFCGIILVPTMVCIFENAPKNVSRILGSIPIWLWIIILCIPLFYASTIFNKIKIQTLSAVINSFGNLRFLPNTNNNTNFDIEKSQLFEKFDRREDEYSILGRYNDVEFKMSRTCLKKLCEFSEESFLDLHIPKEIRKEFTKNEFVFNGILLEFKTNNNYPFVAAEREYSLNSFVSVFLILIFILFLVLLLLIPTVGCLYLIFFSIIMTNELKIVFVLILLMYLYFMLARLHINQIICRYIDSVYAEITICKKSTNEKKERNNYNIFGCEKIITPEVLSILEGFKKSFNSEKINYAFYDNVVLFAIAGGGIEPIMPHNLFKKKTYEPFFKTMEAIYTAADYFSEIKD